MTLLQFAHEHPVVTVLVVAIPFLAACTVVGLISDTKIQIARAKEWNDRRERHGRDE